ncbi:uncharacterized protein LOC134798977 [Cydia splendana]|uniref:uncharacterized protein LOC134798977 n=1 Tax=Cydia splendana TaxID=1100963 RepID=UPI00300D617C
MYLLLTTLLPLLIIPLVTSRATVAPTHLFLSRVGPCADSSKMAVRVSELSIMRRFYDFILSGQLNITGNFSDGWDIKATMQKCPDIRNTDTCDHYRSFTVVSGGCSGESLPGFDHYSMFFHYLSPKMSCPIKPGQYRIENYPFFTEDNYLAVTEAKISTSVFGYTVRLEGYSDSEQILCVEAYLRLLYLRDHNWLDLETAATEPPPTEEDD